jgi:hypothetical protein
MQVWGSLLRAMLSAALVAGTIDIGAACLINGVNPIVICQAIASGALGKSSFQEGLSSAAFGLALQWLMSLIIVACCFLSGHRVPWLRRRWQWAGVAYGVVIYLVMNYVVVPLSAVGHRPHFGVGKFLGNLVAMLLFGLIVSFFARERAAPGAAPAHR